RDLAPPAEIARLNRRERRGRGSDEKDTGTFLMSCPAQCCAVGIGPRTEKGPRNTRRSRDCIMHLPQSVSLCSCFSSVSWFFKECSSGSELVLGFLRAVLFHHCPLAAPGAGRGGLRLFGGRLFGRRFPFPLLENLVPSGGEFLGRAGVHRVAGHD